MASLASQLALLLRDARRHGRPAPASVQRATDDLWRWAEHSLIPRGRGAVQAGSVAGEGSLPGL
jgi:hypothetical protein